MEKPVRAPGGLLIRLRSLPKRRWWPVLVWAPPAALLLYVLLFGVDIPFGDPWDALLPQIVKSLRGELTFADLLAQQRPDCRGHLGCDAGADLPRTEPPARAA